jgi:hypothetical protein
MKSALALLVFFLAQGAWGCELCAIYGADNALGQSGSGFIFTLSEQYIPYDVSQLAGNEIKLANPNYVNSWVTHLVAGYNFSPAFGVNLNLPFTYLDFKRTDLRYSLTALPALFTEKSTEFGLSDLALVGRFSMVRKQSMHYSLFVTLLGGIKFPTGDASRLEDEVNQSKIFQSFLPPGTPHDPLAHSITSVHQHMLALGSGSYDGVFGLTENARWQRWFLNAQFQYYLRTEGEAGFQYGDELLLSGGPGGFLWLGESFTVALQLNALYDVMRRDELLGQSSDRTGSTSWFIGPLMSFTWGSRFSLTAGVDLPLRIANNGFQSVPSFRAEAGISYRF